MQEKLQTIAKKLARESTSWTSIELGWDAVDQRTAELKVNKDSTYIETAAGQRLLEERIRRSDGTGGRQLFFFDGETGGMIQFDSRNPEKQHQAIFNKYFGLERPGNPTQRPLTLRYRYLIQEPLHLAIPRGKALDASRVLGRDCLPVLFENGLSFAGQPARDITYHLDLETGIPLKVEVATQGKTSATWTALSFDKVDDWHLVKSSKLVSILPDGSSQEQTETIDQALFNQSYPEARFRPEIQQGVRIQGDPGRKAARPEPARPPEDKGVEPVPSVGPPSVVPASVPASGDSWIVPTMLGVGVTLLAVGVGLVIRKRSRSG